MGLTGRRAWVRCSAPAIITTATCSKQAAAEDLFLNVLQPTDNGKALPVGEVDAKPIIGVQVADRVVVFNRQGTRLAKPFRFQVQSGDTLKILVTDLDEGNWQVWRESRIVKPAMEVSAEAGTLYFEGPAGNYELRR